MYIRLFLSYAQLSKYCVDLLAYTQLFQVNSIQHKLKYKTRLNVHAYREGDPAHQSGLTVFNLNKTSKLVGKLETPNGSSCEIYLLHMCFFRIYHFFCCSFCIYRSEVQHRCPVFHACGRPSIYFSIRRHLGLP